MSAEMLEELWPCCFHIEEEGSGVDESNQPIKADKAKVAEFRAALTKLGDIYINDAFGTAHRDHASMTGVNLPIRAAGNLIKKELDAFIPVLEKPHRPVLSILGGAKVTDKIKLIKNLLDKVNEMIICGGMAYTFLKVAFNVVIGDSLFDAKGAEIVQELLTKAQEKNVQIHLPIDFKCGDKFEANCNVKVFTREQSIPKGWQGMEDGPVTLEKYKEAIARANTVVWNGPAAVYEFYAFQAPSLLSLKRNKCFLLSS
jgi:phosphoglycerate kinase